MKLNYPSHRALPVLKTKHDASMRRQRLFIDPRGCIDDAPLAPHRHRELGSKLIDLEYTKNFGLKQSSHQMHANRDGS
jgi:hypothetical protein